jgi:hypothetical protein
MWILKYDAEGHADNDNVCKRLSSSDVQDLDHTQRPEPDTSNARDAGEMRVHPALS